jgi:hypothetical protein
MRRGVGGGDRPAASGAIQWRSHFGSEGKQRGGEMGSRGGDMLVAFRGRGGRRADGGAEQWHDRRRKVAVRLGQRKGMTPKVGWAGVGCAGQ